VELGKFTQNLTIPFGQLPPGQRLGIFNQIKKGLEKGPNWKKVLRNWEALVWARGFPWFPRVGKGSSKAFNSRKPGLGDKANKYRGPKEWFVNKMDRIGADFFEVERQIKERLRCQILFLSKFQIGSRKIIFRGGCRF